MSNPFHGDVLPRGVPTSDGRCFTEDSRLAASELPLPVFTYDGQHATEVGRVDAYADIDDRLSVAGTIDLPAGEYPCGIEVDQLSVDMHRGLEKALASGGDPTTVLFGAEVEYYSAARLRRLTVYLGDDAESKPAWPGTHITVTEGATTP